MPSKFMTNIRSFLGNAFLNSISTTRVTEWATATPYSIGNKCTANGNIYVATTSGTSGVNSPSHISGIFSDGGVSWVYVESNPGNKIFESNLYIGIGKASDWSNPLSPDSVLSINSTETDALNNLISLKSIRPGNMTLCAPRYDWSSGTVYSQYSDTKEFDDYTTPFYVMTDLNDVYICLDNFNSAQSTSKPTGYQVTPFRTVDGYVWKYMGSVDSADASIFMTNSFVPLNVKTNSSQGPNQWAVQNAAQENSISTFVIAEKVGSFNSTPTITITGSGTGAVAGAHKTSTTLDQVYIVDPGTGYSKATTIAKVVNGTVAGSGATATATINATTGAITGISITAGGSGYTDGAVALILGTPKSGMTLTKPTSITVEVTAGAVTAINLTGTTANYETATIYILPGTAGAIATPVMAPANGHGKNIVTELNASTVMISVKLTNTINDTGYFLTGTGSDFHQVVLVTDIIDEDTSTFARGVNYLGPAHPSYSTPGSLNTVVKGSGTVLFIDNITTVVRESNQEEDIRVTVTL